MCTLTSVEKSITENVANDPKKNAPGFVNYVFNFLDNKVTNPPINDIYKFLLRFYIASKYIPLDITYSLLGYVKSALFSRVETIS